MRIISGEWKGRRLPATLPAGVRPTLDAARETIFNILNNHYDFNGIRICDICAGSGALGFEALSRGAAHVTFVEKNRKVASVIATNAASLGVNESRYTILVMDAVAFVQQHHEIYQIVFTDPPYAQRIISSIIGGIVANTMLDKDGIIVAEHGAFETVLTPDVLEVFSSRTFGETIVDFLRIKTE